MAWHTPVWHWLAHGALWGLLFLVAGSLALRLVREPARRIRLVELTLLACLLAPWAGYLPGVSRWSLGWLDAPGPEQPPPADPAPAPLAGGDTLAVPAPAPAGVAGVGSGPGARPPTVPGGGTVREEGATPQAAETEPQPARPSLPLLLVIAYAAGASVLLLRWLAGVVQLARLCRTASPAPPAVARLFRSIAGPRGEGVRLVASEGVGLPLMFCWWRPVILLPAGLCDDGDSAALRYCLAHEWSHVERRDAWSWHLATLAQLVLFYQPLYWWLRRQLRLCQDYLADAHAAEQADMAEDYAAYLVRVARCRCAEPTALALGIRDRHSNLYRRIVMLIDNDRPLERRCRGAWTFGAGLAALLLLAAACAVRLDGAPPAAKEEKKDQKKAAPVKGETLNYSGRVTDKDTGKPIPGATVTVRRSLYGDPRTAGKNEIVGETKHKTDAEGKYRFVIPPEQSGERYLYIELDVEHDDYAPRANFGYALSMIRKNEKVGGRPFFEHVEMRPGKPVRGVLETPDGKPAVGVKVLAYSRSDNVKEGEFEYGSFATAKTDEKGRFRVVLTTPGEAVIWLLPKAYAPTTHKLKPGQRGDLGTFGLQNGITFKGKVLDAKGKALAGVSVNVERKDVPADEQVNFVADHIGRAALTNDKGEFEMGPLAPGEYLLYPAEHHRDPTDFGRDRKRQPLRAVFLRQRLVLKEGEKPETVEVRAVPHVTIEAQHYDGKGKKTRGHEFMIFGRLDGESYFTDGKQDADGKVTALVPHGLEQAQLNLMTNEHGVLRWRKAKGEPLETKRRVDLGTLTADVKGFEIIRYTAPVLVVKVAAKDGGTLNDVGVTGDYPEGKGPGEGKNILKGGRRSDVRFEDQDDGRFRSKNLLPDQDVTIAAHAAGYPSRSETVRLPEGETKEIVITLEKSK